MSETDTRCYIGVVNPYIRGGFENIHNLIVSHIKRFPVISLNFNIQRA